MGVDERLHQHRHEEDHEALSGQAGKQDAVLVGEPPQRAGVDNRGVHEILAGLARRCRACGGLVVAQGARRHPHQATTIARAPHELIVARLRGRR